MSTLTGLSQADIATLADRLAPHLHPLARERVDLLQEQERLLAENKELEEEISAGLPAAQAATTKHQETAAEIQLLQKQLLLEQRESQRLWAPILDMRSQRGRNNVRLQDITALVADLDKRIASRTTLRPKP